MSTDYGTLFGEEGRKKKGTRLPIIRTRKGLDGVSDEQEFFVAGFPGVNVVRAKSLLEKFGSPFDVITSTDEWGEISGIGSKPISNAKKMLHTKYDVEPEEYIMVEKCPKCKQPDNCGDCNCKPLSKSELSILKS